MRVPFAMRLQHSPDAFFRVLLMIFLSLLRFSTAAGPVLPRNFPDPCIAQSKSGEWFAFSTESGGINIQVASSPDFETWTFHEGYDALPTLPPWTVRHPHARVWAPDVNALPMAMAGLCISQHLDFSIPKGTVLALPRRHGCRGLTHLHQSL
jgi:hypothetical protein